MRDEGSLFVKDLMIRSAHAGLSLATRVIEHVDVCAAFEEEVLDIMRDLRRWLQ